MTFVLIQQDTFTRANTTAGTAGTTTGVAGDGLWTDVHGGVANISTDRLLLTADSVDGSGWERDFVLRPTAENKRDGQAYATFNTADGNNSPMLVLRYNNSGTATFYGVLWNYTGSSGGFTANVYALNGSSPTQIGTEVSLTIPTASAAKVIGVTFSAVGASPTTLVLTVVNVTDSSTLYSSVTSGNIPVDSTAALQVSGQFGVGPTGPQSTTSYLRSVGTYYQSTATMSASPSAIYANTHGNVITLTGVGTAFSGTPFTILNGAITGTTITSGTSATVTIIGPSTPGGTVTITDSVSGATVVLSVIAKTMSVSPTSMVEGTTANLSLVGVGTQWTSSWGFSVSSGTINSITFVDATHYTLNVTAPLTAGTVTITDTDTSGPTCALTVSAGSATGFSVTPNPISGTPGSPTSAITITMNAPLAASESIALSDSGAGGTFTPTSLSFATSDMAKTFTYTPAGGSSGSIILTATGTGAFSATHNITCNVSTGPVTVPVTDANMFFSPYGWDPTNSGQMEALTPGAYFKLGFTGTSAILNIVTSQNSGTEPQVEWSIDDAPFQLAQLTGTSLSLATGLASGSHQLELRYLAAGGGVGWGPPTQTVLVTGVTLDAGTMSVAPTLVRPKRGLVFHDSMGQGVYATGGGSGGPNSDNALFAYVKGLFTALNAEYGQLCFTGQGYTFAGAGGAGPVPLFTPGNDTNSSWDKYRQGRSRLATGGFFSPAPDYIFVPMGHNDHTADQSNGGVLCQAVQGLLAALRAAAPSAWIFQVIPFSGQSTAGITFGFNAYQAAAPDAKCVLLNTQSSAHFNLLGNPTSVTVDGVHPFYQFHGVLGAQLAALAQAQITPASGGGGGGSGSGTYSRGRVVNDT